MIQSELYARGTMIGEALFNLRKLASGQNLPSTRFDPAVVADVRTLLNHFDSLVAKLDHVEAQRAPIQSTELRVSMPLHITSEMVKAVTAHPTTSIEDKEQRLARIGWLVFAYDVLVGSAPNRA